MTNKELYFELRGVIADVEESGFDDVCLETIKRVADAIAQTEQEPVAWMEIENDLDDENLWCERKMLLNYDNGRGVPLYTAPPQREWQGLTDDDVADLRDNTIGLSDLILAVEAKLKEKNT